MVQGHFKALLKLAKHHDRDGYNYEKYATSSSESSDDNDSDCSEDRSLYQAYGKGKSKKGYRNYFGRNSTFSRKDLMTSFWVWDKRQGRRVFNTKRWKRYFGMLSRSKALSFFKRIKAQYPRADKETVTFRRNKFLLWCHYLHSGCRWFELGLSYNLSEQTVIKHCNETANAVLATFGPRGERLIKFPSIETQAKMVRTLADRKEPLPGALFYTDGTKRRCRGFNIPSLRTYSYKWRSTCNFVLVFNRLTHEICALSTGHPGTRHDIKIWATLVDEYDLNDKFKVFPCLADKGFVGAHTDFVAFTPTSNMLVLRENYKYSHLLTKSFWKAHKTARAGAEHRISDFHFKQFPTLGIWRGTGRNSFEQWDLHTFAGACLWNWIKRS